jgi:hypothetical protein
MTKQEAWQEGFDVGYESGIYGEFEPGVSEDEFISECYEIEDNKRQYSPFEFTASEINKGRNPEGQWEAYDEGVRRGILKAWAERPYSS